VQDENLSLEVLNLQGQIVHQQANLVQGSNSVDLSQMAKGLYWLKVSGNATQIVLESVLVD
jgi:hypothetical protein